MIMEALCQQKGLKLCSLHRVKTLLIAVLVTVDLTIHGVQSHPLTSGSQDPLGDLLLLISFDGFRWNYLDRTETPNFDRIVKNGVKVNRGLKNAFVTKTFPNHNTIASGLWEESHGIIANTMYDPDLKQHFSLYNKSAVVDPAWFDVGAEPIWVTNQLQTKGGRSGVIMWPGGGAPVKYVVPSRYYPYDEGLQNDTKIDMIINWFLDRNPINLGLMYFIQPDKCGHGFGPDSIQMTNMIRGLDGVVGYLLRRLEETKLMDRMNLIITSDHGFTETPHSKIIDLDNYVEPTLYNVTATSPIACLWPHEGKLKEVHSKLKAGSVKNGNFVVYYRDEIPERYHYSRNRRICPVIAVANDTYSFNMTGQPYFDLGGHGYDNNLQDMHPFFVAMGPAFKKNFRVETFQSVDIYPLMCHLLNIVPAPNNGSMEVVSQLLVTPQKATTATTTLYTYIAAALVIALVAGVYAMAACRYQRFKKRTGYVRNITDLNSRVSPEREAGGHNSGGTDSKTPLLVEEEDIH